MKKEQILGILRHLLTFVGGILVARGIGNSDLVAEITGGLVTAVGGLWSFFAKNPTVLTENNQ
jgi:hypothetical protein